MPKTVTKRQMRYLFSKGSPLTPMQKAKFQVELHSGIVKIVKKKKGKK